MVLIIFDRPEGTDIPCVFSALTKKMSALKDVALVQVSLEEVPMIMVVA